MYYTYHGHTYSTLAFEATSALVFVLMQSVDLFTDRSVGQEPRGKKERIFPAKRIGCNAEKEREKKVNRSKIGEWHSTK